MPSPEEMRQFNNDHSAAEVQLWIGSATFPHCTIDRLEGDRLTVTHVRSEQIVETYEAGLWKSATAYDSTGHPTHRIVATTPAKRYLTDAEIFAGAQP